MRPLLISLALTLLSCRQSVRSNKGESANQSILVDTGLREVIKQKIKLQSVRHYSDFKTAVTAYFFQDEARTDSILDSSFNMVSWYSSYNDTIDLVAHIGEFETAALLLRFVKGNIAVRYYRASHEHQKYYRSSANDSFSDHIEAPPTYSKLELSEIPDTLNKQVIYGHIDMESAGYYDARETTNHKHKTKMAFYFRSQCRKFDK